MSDRLYADRSWESLLRTFVDPKTEMSRGAWDEMLARLDWDKQDVFQIIIERARGRITAPGSIWGPPTGRNGDKGPKPRVITGDSGDTVQD